MPKFDCPRWAEPEVEVERGGLWHPEKGSDFCASCVKNVFFTDTATIVHVAPTFKFVVNHFHFYDENRTYLMDDQGNEYKYIKTIYPSFHLDAAVFGTYGVFEPINPNNIKSFSLMGPEPTVYTTIKNIRPRKDDKWYLRANMPWNKVCETFMSMPGVKYVELTDSVRYVSELGVSVDEGKDEKVEFAERLVITDPEVTATLFKTIWKESPNYERKNFKTSISLQMNDKMERISFEDENGTCLFTYSRSVCMPSQDFCKVIINGVEHPELKTKQQAKAYIDSLKVRKWSSSYWTTRIVDQRDTIYEPTFEITFK